MDKRGMNRYSNKIQWHISPLLQDTLNKGVFRCLFEHQKFLAQHNLQLHCSKEHQSLQITINGCQSWQNPCWCLNPQWKLWQETWKPTPEHSLLLPANYSSCKALLES